MPENLGLVDEAWGPENHWTGYTADRTLWPGLAERHMRGQFLELDANIQRGRAQLEEIEAQTTEGVYRFAG